MAIEDGITSGEGTMCIVLRHITRNISRNQEEGYGWNWKVNDCKTDVKYENQLPYRKVDVTGELILCLYFI